MDPEKMLEGPAANDDVETEQHDTDYYDVDDYYDEGYDEGCPDCESGCPCCCFCYEDVEE